MFATDKTTAERWFPLASDDASPRSGPTHQTAESRSDGVRGSATGAGIRRSATKRIILERYLGLASQANGNASLRDWGWNASLRDWRRNLSLRDRCVRLFNRGAVGSVSLGRRKSEVATRPKKPPIHGTTGTTDSATGRRNFVVKHKLFIEFDLVLPQHRQILILEPEGPMMFDLIFDVLFDFHRHRLTDGERTVASLPTEFGVDLPFMVDPVGRICLDTLDCFRKRNTRVNS